MAKRLRQTSLFETAKKRCEESSSVSVDRDQESPSTDSELDPQSGIVQDATEPNAQIQENGRNCKGLHCCQLRENKLHFNELFYFHSLKHMKNKI